MKIFRSKTKKAGFTLVETLVATSIFSMSIVAIMAVIGDGMSDATYAKQKLAAGYLAQEGIEYIRNMRDTFMLFDINGGTPGWTAAKAKLNAAGCGGASGCYFDDEDLNYGSINESMANLEISACPGTCPLLSYNSTAGKYGYYGASVGYSRKITYQNINSNEIKVFSTVSWVQGSGSYSVTFTENLFNWIE